MRILVTNDDGCDATGIRVLASAAGPLGDVSVVAPDREQSGTSHSITLHRPLRARHTPDGWWAVEGTPVDSVVLGVAELLPSAPDLCLSGINHGPNLGEVIRYSGTVSAAMEATVHGIRAVAFSYAGRGTIPPDTIAGWREIVHSLLSSVVARNDFPLGSLLNVNLPPIDPGEVRGIKVTSLGRSRFEGAPQRLQDPSGKEFFWLGGGKLLWEPEDGCDFCAIKDGYVSVSPVHLDLTNHDITEEIRGWNLTL